jgi:ribosomal protein L37AE/L43A
MSKTTPSQDLIEARRKRDAKLRENPTCSHCGKTKTFNDFPKGCVDYWCTKCRTAYAREAWHKKRNAMSKPELRKLRDKVNNRQIERRNKKLASMTPQELKEYKAEINAGTMARRLAVRDEVYRAYGGYKCACCGETEPSFLSIDHINNDGAAHKRKYNLHTGEQLYRWLKRNNFPAGFQVLCMNCQWGKRNNNGVCPHQLGTGVTTIPEGSRAKRLEAQRTPPG